MPPERYTPPALPKPKEHVMHNTRHLIKTFSLLILNLLLFAGAALAADCNLGTSYKRIRENTILHNGTEFKLDDAVRTRTEKSHPLLIVRILNTESMENDERQYWFDTLPGMTDAQVARLWEILETERLKLCALEERYKQEIRELNARHMEEWERHEEQERAKKTKPSGSKER